MESVLAVHRSKQNGLQLLRVLAAVLVLVHHATAIVWGRYRDVLTTWGPGAMGVDIFFVLSGFVMVYSSSRLAGVAYGWAAFAQRRIVRIVPVYWLATTTILCAMRFLPQMFQRHGSLVIPAVCSYFFLPSRDFGGGIHPLLVVGWTLNFEMFFYALFCLALLLEMNVLIFVGIALALISVASLFVHPHPAALAFYLDPIVLEFYFGMLLARLGVGQSRLKMLIAGPLLVFSGIIFLWPSTLAAAWRPLRIGLPAAGIVWACLALEPMLHRTPRFLLFLADASYVIYLFHVMLMPVLVKFYPTHPSVVSQFALAVWCVVASLIFGGLLHYYVEKPILIWCRQHWRMGDQKTIQVI